MACGGCRHQCTSPFALEARRGSGLTSTLLHWEEMSRTPATSRVTSSHPAQLSLLLAPLPPRLPDSAGGWDRGGLAWAAQRTLIQPLSATMSGSRFPGPDRGAPEPLLDDLIGYYTDRAEEGQLRVCRQAALIRRAQQLLGMRAPPQLCLPEDVAPDLEPPHSQGAPSSAQHICHKLVRALEFLELISVNLLLSPWRKEIRSLKEGSASPKRGGLGRGQGSAFGGDGGSIMPTDFSPVLQLEKLRAEEVTTACLWSKKQPRQDPNSGSAAPDR